MDPEKTTHLLIRIYSCNIFLLHRRAELKAAPGST